MHIHWYHLEIEMTVCTSFCLIIIPPFSCLIISANISTVVLNSGHSSHVSDKGKGVKSSEKATSVSQLSQDWYLEEVPPSLSLL